MTGWIGLAGLIIGGALAIVGQWVPAAVQRRQAQAELRLRVLEARRDAYEEFVKHHLRLNDRIHTIWHSTATRALDLQPEYAQVWLQFVDSAAPVHVMGPQRVSDACRDLHSAWALQASVCDEWLAGVAAGKLTETSTGDAMADLESRYAQADQSVRDAWQAFRDQMVAATSDAA